MGQNPHAVGRVSKAGVDDELVASSGDILVLGKAKPETVGSVGVGGGLQAKLRKRNRHAHRVDAKAVGHSPVDKSRKVANPEREPLERKS